MRPGFRALFPRNAELPDRRRPVGEFFLEQRRECRVVECVVQAVVVEPLPNFGIAVTASSAFSSFSCTGAGVAAGTNTPYQFSITTPGRPTSLVVTRSGISGERSGANSAIAFIFPALTSGISTGRSALSMSTWSPRRSVIAGAAPR